MDLSVRWMEGDFDLLMRWGEMCRKEPVVHGRSGIDSDLFQFISKAIDLRLATFQKYLNPGDVKRLNAASETEWITLGETAERLIREGAPVESGEAQALAYQWSDLFDRIADSDPVIREKLLTALRNEPLLQAGLPISAKARDFIRRAHEAAVDNQRNPCQ
jgi:hypothetical protein